MAQAQVTQSPSTTKGKNKGQVSAGKGKSPVVAGNAAFGAIVAAQAKQSEQAAVELAPVVAAVTMPQAATAAHVAAHAGFVRPVQNGRKGYAPNTIGALIFATADKLQAAQSAPVTSASMRLALPQVAPASISAGLSHWRKFNGTLRVKGQVRLAPVVAPVEAPAPTLASSLALLGIVAK